jgi:hypothetical protein
MSEKEKLTAEEEKELAEFEAQVRRLKVVDSLKPENIGKTPHAITEEPEEIRVISGRC